MLFIAFRVYQMDAYNNLQYLFIYPVRPVFPVVNCFLLNGLASGLAECNRGLQQGVDVTRRGAVIDDRGANGEATIDGGRGRRGNAGFLQGDDDLRIDPVGIRAAVAETHDVERNRREEFQLRRLLDAMPACSGPAHRWRKSSGPVFPRHRL